MDLDRKRWLVILAGMLANFAQGSAYAFSVYAGPLIKHLGCDKTQLALAFSLNVGLLAIGTIVAGKIADQRGPRLAVACGGVLYGVGMFLAGYANSLPWLYVTYGVMMSLGSGAAYGAVVGAAVKWFPDRRGLASGLVVGAIGFGPVVIAPLAQKMIDIPCLGVLGTFKILGAVFLFVIVAASWFITSPPKGYAPANFTPSNRGAGSGSDLELNWSRMIARGRFWLLYVLYICGSFSGLMIVSQAKDIAQAITRLDAMAAALIVSVLAAANASGRVVWGALSDRLGRYNSLVLMFLITAVTMFLLSPLAGSVSTLVVAMTLIGLCYGGYLGIFPSMCAEAFGNRNVTVNYGVLFSGFSIAGVLGPYVGAKFAPPPGSMAHSFPQAFVIAGSVAVLGLLLSVGASLSERRKAHQ